MKKHADKRGPGYSASPALIFIFAIFALCAALIIDSVRKKAAEPADPRNIPPPFRTYSPEEAEKEIRDQRREFDAAVKNDLASRDRKKAALAAEAVEKDDYAGRAKEFLTTRSAQAK